MARSTRRIRYVLGLAMLALGLLCVGSAQAATWLVAGSNLTSGEKSLKGNVAGESISLLTKILGSEVKFSCKKAELIGTALKPEGRLTEGAKARFTECKTFISGKESKPCEPANNGTEKGVIATNGLKGELTEYQSEEGVIVVKSTVEEEIEKVKQPVFAQIKMSEECAIGSKVPVFGSKIALVDSGGLVSLMNQTTSHKFKASPLTELWVVKKSEEHKVTIDGEAEASLTSGEEWAGLPLANNGLVITPVWWKFFMTGAEATFTIKNDLVNTTITDLSVTVIGGEANFAISGSGCSNTLAGNGATCQISIRCLNLNQATVLEARSAMQNVRYSALLAS
jgi:hypothetical protein